MQIEVIDVKTENKGKYRVAVVTYKDDKGKVDAKNIPSFDHKEVFKSLSEAKLGDKFDVRFEKVEKDGKTYWNWAGLEAAGKNTEAGSKASSTSTTVRSSYETPEERAKRQVYIVRQSSLERAVQLAAVQGVKTFTEEDAISSARKFEAYVFDTDVKEARVE